MKKILIIICAIISIIIFLYIIFFICVIVEYPHPTIVGELDVYYINKTNNNITFRIIISKIQAPEPEAGIYSDGVYDENLHNPDISKRRYTLWLVNNTTIIKNPTHKYIDVQNDYKINTNDFIIIYNMSQYFGFRIFLEVGGVGGMIEGKIPADPNLPEVAQWQRGMSCWEWFVHYLRDELAVLDIDWYMNTLTYVPLAELWDSGENVKVDMNFDFAKVSHKYGFKYDFENLYEKYTPKEIDIA